MITPDEFNKLIEVTVRRAIGVGLTIECSHAECQATAAQRREDLFRQQGDLKAAYKEAHEKAWMYEGLEK